jgi:hypothetical protein
MAAASDALRVERLVLALNGRRYEAAADELDPSTTLLEFIRTRTPFRGPKLGCGEGTYIVYIRSSELIASFAYFVSRALLLVCALPAC